MTASLRVKNDKYYVVLTHTTDGKKNQTWVSTGLTVTGNEVKARQIMLDMLGEKPEQAAPPDMLFSDAVRRWLEDVRHRVDEVTYQGYEVQARAHILPYFDDLQIQLCDVDGETLQTYINVKAKFGRSDGHGGLSAVSLRQHKNVLNQTLKLAQRDGLIQTNPADLVVMPHAAQFTGTFYTEAQMRDLLTAVKNERLYPIIYVTALYGLRRSEVLGLKWDSINFAMQTLTIRHTVARVTKVVEKNKTKNASSFRSFPLTDDAVRLFKILLQQEQYYRNHYGKDYIDNDYVFTWEDGHPYSPDYVSHTFHKLLKKYDLPHIRFHDLRHPYVKHTTKIFSLRLMDFQAQAYPDARRKTRGACQLLRGGQSRSPVRPLCNRKRFSYLPPQSKISWILYATSIRLSGYTSTRSISSSASSVVSVSASKIALDASLRLSCRVCSSCFCFACANTAA